MKRWKTTGKRSENEAVEFILDQFRSLGIPLDVGFETTLRRFLEPYYTEHCPHVLRLRDERKSITHTHIKACRAIIEKKILTDPIADINVHQLKRRDIIDFRSRLFTKYSPRIVNRTLGVLKTSLKEGYFREDLHRDPTVGIGNIKYEVKESGIFTKKELQNLFPRDSLGPWPDRDSYVAFLIAATCGLPRGEILALIWRYIDFENMQILVEQAWKEGNTLGKPKWNKTRKVPLPEKTAEALKVLRSESMYILPDSFVFCNSEGRRLYLSWFYERFKKVMDATGIDV